MMKQTQGFLMKEPGIEHYVWCANEDHAKYLARNGYTGLGIKNRDDVLELQKRGARVQVQF